MRSGHLPAGVPGLRVLRDQRRPVPHLRGGDGPAGRACSPACGGTCCGCAPAGSSSAGSATTTWWRWVGLTTCSGSASSSSPARAPPSTWWRSWPTTSSPRPSSRVRWHWSAGSPTVTRSSCLKDEGIGIDLLVRAGRPRPEEVWALARRAHDLEVGLCIAPHREDASAHMAVSYVPLGRTPLLVVETPTLHPVARTIKAMFDRSFGLLMVIGLSPVLLVIAALVLVREGRPIFYSQERVGRGGRPFKCYKFRTMHVDADPRLARAGRPQRGRRPAVQDPRRPAGHAHRFVPAQPLARRAPAAVQRAQRVDVDRGPPSPAAHRGGHLQRARGPPPPREAGPHGPVAGRRAAPTSPGTRASTSTCSTSTTGACCSTSRSWPGRPRRSSSPTGPTRPPPCGARAQAQSKGATRRRPAPRRASSHGSDRVPLQRPSIGQRCCDFGLVVQPPSDSECIAFPGCRRNRGHPGGRGWASLRRSGGASGSPRCRTRSGGTRAGRSCSAPSRSSSPRSSPWASCSATTASRMPWGWSSAWPSTSSS